MNFEEQKAMQQASVHQDCLKRLEKVGYGEPEVCKMDSFLGHFSSWAAQIYLTNLFVRARIHRKHFWTVLSIYEVYRHAVWSESSPDRYGDPDDVSVDEHGDCRGARNAGAMARVYLALNLPFSGLH